MLLKMTWGIWDIFTIALESLKIGTFMAFFCLKLKMCEFGNYRGVMCHDKEEWCKNWTGIVLSVENWHEEFNKFWPEHSKISHICTLMGCFSLEITEEICLMSPKIDAKFEGKLICTAKNDMRNLGNFHQSTWNLNKIKIKIQNNQVNQMQCEKFILPRK